MVADLVITASRRHSAMNLDRPFSCRLAALMASKRFQKRFAHPQLPRIEGSQQ
jgi:hypothetical protein